MTDLTKLLKERLEFDLAQAMGGSQRMRTDDSYASISRQRGFVQGTKAENARLQPIHSALIECVVAADKVNGNEITFAIRIEDLMNLRRALTKLREVLGNEPEG